ncbi:MAG: CDP-glycerol glycerophosphotransferase family protein [Treponema sp.]|uniref:CDP-glycerol glycerophosphotransferase family protein n=1 Tax=Treponema sp. TaxID=166 RepID=UPI00298D6085|nr:CDP-glycerol glycerophosphotransferase family protein [Treponema sp.]MCR5385567.1 CDP-glycerol glycerophosphotransferase family protein [Treponema sp.]
MLLYIDPGTGSMLFSIVIGIATTLLFFAQKIFVKLKFILSGGKAEKISSTKMPYVIFSDHKRYWNVFKPICDEFENRGVDIVYWTASPDDPALSEKYDHVKTEFIGEGNKAFARLNMMNAGICLSTTPGLDVYQWKRSQNCRWYVHVFHSVSDGTGYRMFGLNSYDAVLAGGPIVKKYLDEIAEKRNLPKKEIITCGITYMDSLLEKYKRYEGTKQKENGKTVLLAPSWGASSILSKYGEKIIDSLLKTDWKIIIRPHPQSLVSEKQNIDSLKSKYPDCERLKWDFDIENFPSLYDSDIMISDYSGVIYDYAFIFNKPVIYAKVNFDPSPYDAAWIDDEKWMIKILPDIGFALDEKDFDNMQKILDDVKNDKSLDAKRKEKLDLCWQNIGKSGVCITDYLIKKYSDLFRE